ncbi:MAG: hypothetical protein IMZ46_04160 [Acidobacteria bacterium]|nr:hypothetical protein [Acidobacteriota bacterium]
MSVGKKYVTKDDSEAFARKLVRRVRGARLGGGGWTSMPGGEGGAVPTGTGFRHVVAGAEDAAAKLVENNDVDGGAAIAESKLDLDYPTHSNILDHSDILDHAQVHDILSTDHGDTLPDAIEAGDILIGNATPKLARLAAAAEGQILEMGAALPGWGRKITISASDPSGGSNGDIWMKY